VAVGEVYSLLEELAFEYINTAVARTLEVVSRVRGYYSQIGTFYRFIFPLVAGDNKGD